MPVWSFRVWLAWTVVMAVGMARLAHGAERAEDATSAVPPHPLVAAAETLYGRVLPQACDEVLKLASTATGLTVDDNIRISFLGAMRDLDERNELGARRALSQALQLDPAAVPPPSAPRRLNTLLDQVRAEVHPGTPAKGAEARRSAKAAASAREPAPEALLRAVDALYATQIEGASTVLEMALSSTPVTAANRTQFALRRGILAMESADEREARAAFYEALAAEPAVLLPGYAPPKTRGIFEDVKHMVSARTATAEHPPVQPMASATATAALSPVEQPPANGQRTRGLVAGGAGVAMILGGVVAGTVAWSTYEAEKAATAAGDLDGYVRNRDAAGAAVITANGLYVAGAVALGVSAYLFWSAPEGLRAGAGVSPGNVSLTVGGSF